jgi:integrase
VGVLNAKYMGSHSYCKIKGKTMATGSIRTRKLKSTKNGRPEVRYAIRYDIGVRWNESLGTNKRIQRAETVPPPHTRKHAEKLLAKRLSQINKGEFIEPSKMFFRDFTEHWVNNYARGQVKPGTLADYGGYFKNHLLPAFGEMPLAHIGVEDIQGFKSAKLDAGYKPQTVKHLLRLLRQMLGHAVDWGYVRANPTQKIKNPSVPKTEMDCLTPEEARTFLAAVPMKWYPFFLTAITTGLRIGELLAMRWQNIDWASERYFVKETLSRARYGYKGGFSTPKTEGSQAAVDLTSRCLRCLREHEIRQKKHKLAVGVDYEDQGLIFCTLKGRPYEQKNIVHRQFHTALKDAGLRRIRFHDLRHTTASILINQGAPPKSIQRQMRHASIETTFDTYGHLFPETNSAAIEMMDGALFGSERDLIIGPVRV